MSEVYEPQYYSGVFDEDGTKYILARITRVSSTYDMVAVASTDVSSVTRTVYSVPSSTVIQATTTLSNVVIGLSTGSIWTKDETGFNFIDLVPAASFPRPDEVVTIEYKFTYLDGSVYYLRARGPVLPVEGS